MLQDSFQVHFMNTFQHIETHFQDFIEIRASDSAGAWSEPLEIVQGKLSSLLGHKDDGMKEKATPSTLQRSQLVE